MKLKDYVIVWLKGMGFDPRFLNSDDRIPCEICGEQFHDVHHIDRRGMGGSKKKYYVEQLMGLCRTEHTKYGDQKQYRSFLYWLHFLNMEKLNLAIDYSKLPKDLFFDQYSDEQKLTSTYYSLIANLNYVESIEQHIIDDAEHFTFNITKNGRTIIKMSGVDKLEIMSLIIPKL